MITAALVAPALLLGGVLLASGALKLRTPASLDEFAQLGVPASLQKMWIARLHPWGELALGLVLIVAGGWLGALAALAAAALMGTYLVLVVRARRATPDASCACFGSTKKITMVTIVRNAWLTLLGLFAAAAAWSLPLWGGPLAALGQGEWAWLIVIVAAVFTTALIMWPESASVPAPVAPVPASESELMPGGDEQLDYVRSITPAVPVTLADGSTVTLRDLASARPLLTLSVSATCASCESTIAAHKAWRALLPELDIRLLLADGPEASPLTDTAEPMTMHDPNFWVSESLGYVTTPTAVLFGIDGLLAGGPITGGDAIAEFVGDVYESLHGLRPPTD